MGQVATKRELTEQDKQAIGKLLVDIMAGEEVGEEEITRRVMHQDKMLLWRNVASR